ncbi:YciI family protein [Christiangramia sp. SM2212]|uniref:YciI family protein n=1 Tax=Christiangramia sediminicola TaxID=3073267 RepID=A0ABU1ES94_9FLAO|nr:YciI family protein [Christiangramia sp. SM2212]MDR5591270.1 YciI family protein [Christiangramia sp. SM2212]
MKKLLFFICLGLLLSCADNQAKDVSSENEDSSLDTLASKSPDMAKVETELKNKGYQTFSYKEGDTTYLMQQYYMVFLKSGPERSQDSTEAAELQKKHMAHLARMYNEGYTSLTGPMGDDGDLRGIVVYNTATQREADSLANLDPMVQAGRLKVEVHPWWVAKGGKLK